jgi:hypothetical protein
MTVAHLAASAYERHWRRVPEDVQDTVIRCTDVLIVAEVLGILFLFFFFCSANWGSQPESRKDKIDDAILTLMMLSQMVENPAGFVDLAEGLHLGRAREESAS